MINLNDLLKITKEDLWNVRIRLNKHNGNQNPIDLFLQDPSKLLGWNYYNDKEYKIGQIAIGLVQIHSMNGYYLQ